MSKKFGLGICLGFSILVLGFATLSLGCGGSTTAATTTTTTAATTSTTTATTTSTTTSTAAATTTTTSTTSTTAAEPEESQVNSIKIASTVAFGGSNVSSASTGISGALASNPMASAVFAEAASSGPPDSFNDNILTGTASLDGFVSALTAGQSIGFITPYIRLKTRNGNIVAGSYLNGKKIAILGTVEVTDMMNSSPGEDIPGMQAGIMSFIGLFSAEVAALNDPYANNQLFEQITTINEYMAWTSIWPTIEASLLDDPQLIVPANINLTTPEAEINDQIGSMETKMVFANDGGSIIFGIPWAVDGGPEDGSTSGTGNITIFGITMEAELGMTFSNKIPTNLTIVGTIPANSNIVTVAMSDPTTGAGTGALISGETTIATIEVTSSGWTAYFAGGYTTSESF